MLKENPTFFAKGPAELDPDERLSRLRKSISLIGPIKFSNHLKEYNRNASRHNESFSRSRYDQTLPEEQNTFEQLYSEDSGINLTENYSNYSTVDVSRTEIREVRIYRQTRTDVYHQSPRNLFRC